MSAQGAESTHGLTPTQVVILDTLFLAFGEGLTLAHDIATYADVSPRTMGARLRGLEKRGLVRRAIVKSRPSPYSDNLYGWELTPLGAGLVTP